ncbi:MAG: type II toxin-antitoxin system prevent-host-death family antitoxin [Actinobacteria bacterium]|nr:type II toxin-antitoxin system prevent-host-death family antitoxin [Actinomycetota bacterium]
MEISVEVGIRELRNHLSRYLALVRSGEEVVVTDRGRAVARVVPLIEERPIDRLVAEGVVMPARERVRSRPHRRIEGAGQVSDLVAEQRR